MGLALLAWAGAAQAAAITSARLERNHQATRLVLAADAPLEYQVELADPQTVVLEFPAARLDAPLPSAEGDPLVAGLEARARGRGLRLVVRTTTPGVTVLPLYEASARRLTLELGGPPSVERAVPREADRKTPGAARATGQMPERTPARPQPEAQPEPQPEAQAEPQPKDQSRPKAQAEPKDKARPEPQPEPQPKAQAQAAEELPRADQPAQPRPGPAPAGPAPSVLRVRLGTHPEFTRVVLDADQPLEAEVIERGGTALVRLARGGLRSGAGLPGGDRRVRSVQARRRAPLVLALELARPLGSYKLFSAGGGLKTVVDLRLMSPEEAARARAEQKPAAPGAPQEPAAAGGRPEAAEPVRATPEMEVAEPNLAQQADDVEETSPPPPPEPEPDPSAAVKRPPLAASLGPGAGRPARPEPPRREIPLVSPARPAEEPGLVRGRVPPVPPPPTLARPRGQAPARAPAGPPESQRQVVDKVHQAAQDQARRQARAGEAAQARQAPVAGPERRAPQGARLGPLGQRDRAARRLFARAQADLEGRRYAEALNGFEQFLLQYPDHELAGEATFRAADAFFSLHEREMPLYYAQAMEKYQRGVDLYPESDQVPWALLQMGRVAMLAGEPFKAKGYFQIVQEDYPDSEYAPLAMVNIGRAYLADQDFGLALDTFREVAEKYPESRYRKEADWGQAQALFGMARYERASLLLQDMDRRFPRLRLEDPELLYYIGEAEFQLKRYQKARRYFLWALNVMPEIRDNDIILTRVGDTYQFEKAYEAARDIYRRVVKDFPGSDGALVARIRLAESPAKDTDHPWDIFQVQATTDALKTYQEILDNHPQRPVAELAQLKMGVYYYKKKKYAKSLAILEELLQKNPRTPFRPEVTYTLDLTTVAYLQELKRQGKPLALMDAYLRNRASLRRPNSNQMLETLAWAYQRTGLNQRAAKLYRVLISRGLNRPQYHVGLAENLMAEGDYQGVAEALPQKVIAKLADQAAVKGRSLLGRALARLGRCGEAEPLLRYVLEKRFDYPWIAQDYFALGRCLVGMDRVEEGLEALEQAAARFGPDRQLERYLVAMTAGSAARGAGKPRRALGLFERAESLALSDRDRAQAIYEQGQTLRRLDERARVAETFRRLAELKVSPWSDMAARHLADMELAPRLAEVGTGPLDGQ